MSWHSQSSMACITTTEGRRDTPRALWMEKVANTGDIKEALRQADIVEAIRGPRPPSPLTLKLIERLNRLSAENKIIRGER